MRFLSWVAGCYSEYCEIHSRYLLWLIALQRTTDWKSNCFVLVPTTLSMIEEDVLTAAHKTSSPMWEVLERIKAPPPLVLSSVPKDKTGHLYSSLQGIIVVSLLSIIIAKKKQSSPPWAGTISVHLILSTELNKCFGLFMLYKNSYNTATLLVQVLGHWCHFCFVSVEILGQFAISWLVSQNCTLLPKPASYPILSGYWLLQKAIPFSTCSLSNHLSEMGREMQGWDFGHHEGNELWQEFN